MWTAFPPSDYYADSATPRAHQPASGLAGLPPAARRARGASHVHHDPFDRVGSWLYPYSPSGGHSQLPPATAPGRNSRARSEPPLNRAASLLSTTQIRQVSGRSRNRGASTTSSLSLYLSVSLARTRASGSAARPSHCRERLTSGARSRASAVPSFSGPLHQPGAGIPAGTDEMLMSVISFRMAPRGAGSGFLASRTSAGRRGRGVSSSNGSPTRSGYRPSSLSCGARSSVASICPLTSRGAGWPAPCEGTTSTTRCPTTSTRFTPSVGRPSGTGSWRFGVAASARQ